jgi:hypothetical protein
MFRIKNGVTLVLVTIYWMGLDGWYLFDTGIVKFLIPQLIYISTLLVFALQLIGFFIPKLTNNVEQNEEKDYPLKRIKENLFFVLFNMIHVFVLIGGKDCPI